MRVSSSKSSGSSSSWSPAGGGWTLALEIQMRLWPPSERRPAQTRWAQLVVPSEEMASDGMVSVRAWA
jgi:hypothetical protein